MKLLVFACLVTAALCMPGGWHNENLQDAATKQKFMDMLTKLNDANGLALVALPQDFQLVGVKTQVVSGMNYNFTLKMGDHSCYFVYYEQVWTDARRITDNTCSVPITSTPHVMCAGCPSPVDATDPVYMTKLMSVVPLPANGVTINSVQTQVIAGIKYMYDITVAGHHCLIDIVEQAWMTPTTSISRDTCHLTHQKRQLGGVRTGGYSKQDPSDPKWTTMLNYLMSQSLIYVDSNADVKIVSVSQQVVAGMNYDFTISVDGKLCSFVYFVQSWTNTHQIHNDQCGLSLVPVKRQFGGWHPATDSDNDGVQQCLQASLDKVNNMANSMYRLVDSNLHAMVKVVQGMEYQLTFDTYQSACMNNAESQGLTSTHCPAQNSANNMGTMRATCWSRPWLNNEEAYQVTVSKV